MRSGWLQTVSIVLAILLSAGGVVWYLHHQHRSDQTAAEYEQAYQTMRDAGVSVFVKSAMDAADRGDQAGVDSAFDEIETELSL